MLGGVLFMTGCKSEMEKTNKEMFKELLCTGENPILKKISKPHHEIENNISNNQIVDETDFDFDDDFGY